MSKEELWNNRMQDRASTLWREVLDETYNFKRSQMEINFIKVITFDQVRDFYRDWICADGQERRHLVISVGPDPILNKLDIALEGSSHGGMETRHWDLREIEIYRRDAESFTKLSDKLLVQWMKEVFDSESNSYEPPSHYNPPGQADTTQSCDQEEDEITLQGTDFSQSDQIEELG